VDEARRTTIDPVERRMSPDAPEVVKELSPCRRFFGSGPLGVVIGLPLLGLAYLLGRALGTPSISPNQDLLNLLFVASLVAAIGIIAGSVRALPAAKRARILCTSGPFRFVRHPLYAAFVSLANFGLALYLNNSVYLIWAVVMHPVMHRVVRSEERTMMELFGEEYREYASRTGRFFPRIGRP
jgi:protein-S-isoprenylcysteine O-methyltransferase Ste14